MFAGRVVLVVVDRSDAHCEEMRIVNGEGVITLKMKEDGRTMWLI